MKNRNKSTNVADDAGEPQRTEKALRRSEAKYRRLHQSMSDAFASVDMNGFVQESNEAYRKMLGYEPEELLALRYIDLTPEKWHAFEAEIVQNQILPRGYSDIYEKELCRKDGTIVPVELRTFLITDDNNQPLGMWAIVRDIADRKRAEQALKQAHDELERRVEQRTADLVKANEQLIVFRQFVEASMQGFAMAKLNGEITYVNPTIGRLLADGRSEDIIGKHVSTIYSEDYMQKREKEILPALLREGHWEGEVAIAHPGGSVLALQDSFLVRDEQGSPVYVATVLTDITERKRAEEVVRQSEEKYRRLLEACPDAVVMTDFNGRILFASQQVCSLGGLSDPQEWVGRSVFDHVIEGDRRRATENFSRLAETGGRRNIEYTLLRHDGTPVPTEISSALSRDAQGQPIAIMAVIREITERKQAEEALRASEERYDLVVRGAGTGIWDWDIRTSKLYFSPCWKAIFGYGEKDIGDSLEDWARLLHPDEKDWMLKFLEDFLAGTSATVTVEYRLRHKDGSYRWIVAHGLVLRDEQGKAYRFVGSHGDITDRKRAEEALQREHRTLKHLLQSSDHERQLIAYEIHDELAQQLAGAIMQFQTFNHLKETKPKEAAKAYDAAMTMLQQGHFETRRLIAGVRPPILDEDGVVAAVGHLVNEQNRLKGANIEYRSRVAFDRLAPILENGIYRIAQEGLANACQHSKSERVRVSLLQREDRVRIEVRDWGIGFNTKSLQENRFGLEGIRQRARLLGGKCNIRSQMGKGTCVLIELPVVVRE